MELPEESREEWLHNPFTQLMAKKAFPKEMERCLRNLRSSARKSSDADVRAAAMELDNYELLGQLFAGKMF